MALSRGEKKLAIVCAFALAILAGVGAFYGHINATPAVATTPIAKAPTPNGYDLYIQAANSIKRANPPVDANLDTKIIEDPKVRAGRYSVARKDAWLKQNKAGFALFERAQKTPTWAPPFYASGNSKPVRQMARYKVIESNAHWQRGDYGAALQSGLDIAQMGHDVQRGGGLMDFVTGNGFKSLSRVAMGDTIAHLDAKQARRAARRLEELEAGRWTYTQALAEDYERSQGDWLRHFENPDWRNGIFYYRPTFGGPVTWEERWRAQTTSKHRILADLGTAYQHAIANSRLHYGNEAAQLAPLDNIFIELLPNSFVHYRFAAARSLVADRALMLRLALRAHQLEEGAPPTDLQSLVPAYIRAVPADPFGQGEPFRYRTNGQTYTLWSVGPDGRDDNGTPVPWRNAKRKRVRYADEREKLPYIIDDSLGDYVAGRNH